MILRLADECTAVALLLQPAYVQECFAIDAAELAYIEHVWPNFHYL